MTGPKKITIKKSRSKAKETHMRGWVARGYGQEVTSNMVRAGWKRALGPGATLMVTVGKEGEMEGSKWTVRGNLNEVVKFRGSSLWGEDSMNYDVMIEVRDLSVFSFDHKNAGTEPCNMSRWLDRKELAKVCEMSIKKDGEDESKEELIMAALEGLGTQGMCARLVVMPKSVGTATLYLDIVPVKLEDLMEMCTKKKISLKNPFIPTFGGMIGRQNKAGRETRTSGTTIQLVGEDKGLGWGMTPTLVIVTPEPDPIVYTVRNFLNKHPSLQGYSVTTHQTPDINLHMCILTGLDKNPALAGWSKN